ncbi:MAG: hypothetical protein ACOCPE_05200 [Segatella copri]
MKGLYEILTEKKWMVNPDFVHGIRKAWEKSLNEHAEFVKPKKVCGYVTAENQEGCTYYPEEYQISEDGKQVRGNWTLDLPEDNERAQNFPFVSVLTVDGPITRNGGYCSYGSIDHRDMMMRAADHPLCRGHLFIINTPGGSAWAKNDYALAIDYAHSKGQKVISLTDGMCDSAGMYLASLCDERYYLNPKDQVGCIGVMAAFYTLANGSKAKYTDETYHEEYDPESFDKNKAYRDIANKNDNKELVKELTELGAEFRADVKKACPNAKDEHLHGKVFNAEDVKGILMDDQSTFMGCVKRCFDLYNGTAEPIKREASIQKPEPGENEPEQASSSTVQENHQHTNTKNKIDMANYPLINAACGMKEGEIEVKEEGAFMNSPLLDTLEASLKANKQQVADAEQKATTAEQNLADLQAKFDELNANLEAVKTAQADAEKALENLKAEHATAIAKKDEEIKNLTTGKEKAEADLKTAQDSLATANQTIADKDAQIKALGENPGEEPQQGAAPQNNGEGVQTPKLREFDPSLYKTNKERKEAFERFKRGEE